MYRTIGIAAIIALAGIGAASAQDAVKAGGGKMVRITYENLTTGQGFSPAGFYTQKADAPLLFEAGKPASFAIMRIGEEGNTGPLLAGLVGPDLGKIYGTEVAALPTPPGKTTTIDIEVTIRAPSCSA